MKLTVLDMPAATLDEQPAPLERALLRETQFGTGADAAPSAPTTTCSTPAAGRARSSLRGLRDKAAGQLGTSGSGNHFVEFGVLDARPADDLGLDGRPYLALLLALGLARPGRADRGALHARLARELHPELPPELSLPGLARPRLRAGPGVLGAR